MLRWIQEAEHVWKKSWLGYLLIIVSLAVFVRFGLHIPPSGYAVTAMAVVAGIMAIRPEMGGWERSLWFVVLMLFATIEIRAINHDHKDQNDNFSTIAQDLQKTITQSQEQFDATMGKLQKNLETSESTRKNTQPIADLEFQRMEPYGPSLPITAGKQLEVNVYFTNLGTAVATNIMEDVKFYLGKGGDEAAEKRFAADFDKWWPRSTHRPGTPLSSQEPALISHKTDPFTQDQIQAIVDRSITIYVLIRFSYSDNTGNWFGDVCFAIQNPNKDMVVGWPCRYHNNHRYRAR